MSLDDTDYSCAITLCGELATRSVEHPQRGRLAACEYHVKRIRALPDGLRESEEVRA